MPKCALRKIGRGLALAAPLWLAATAGWGSEQKCDVLGRVTAGQGALPAPIKVELHTLDGRTAASSQVMPDGEFEFRAIAPGDYDLVLVRNGKAIHEEQVSIRSQTEDLWVLLPGQRWRTPPPLAATVSLRRLQHHVPDAARKEESKAEAAMEKGQIRRAIGHLQRALKTDPEYPAAHNNLAMCYARQRRYEEALAEFQKAVESDPGSPVLGVNLGLALLSTGRYADAEQAARHALRLSGDNPMAHYVLGLSLCEQRVKQTEALASLRRVEGRFPEARLAAAGILERQGHPEEAAAELRQYLEVPGAIRQEEARAWLAILPH
jgi:tetratricopeptide (TPR) repeat protein